MSEENQNPEENNQNPEPTPPTPEPQSTTPPTDIRAELQNLQLGALSTLHQENQRLKQQLELASRNATPASPDTSDDTAAFLANPKKAIREEMQQLVQPLYDFIGNIKQKDAYTELKDQFKSSPQLGKLLTENEDIVDRLMQGNEVNPSNLQAAIFSAVGMRAAGVLGQPNTTVNNNPNPAPKVDNNPPYIPPSPPAPPRSNNQPKDELKSKVDALTEQERHIARVFNMSLEDYVKMRDADSDPNSWGK